MNKIYKRNTISGLPVFMLALCIIISACEKSPQSIVQEQPAFDPGGFELLAEETIPGASLPNLFKDQQGIIWLSFVTKTTAGSALWLSQWTQDSWSVPELVAEGEDWFVNWADFPSVVKNKNTFIAHWLQKNGSGTYAYGVQYAIKKDDGEWRSMGSLHADNSPTEHGFVSLQPDVEGVHAIWLDGRNMQSASHNEHDSHTTTSGNDQLDIDAITGMTLRYGLIENDGTVDQRTELDALTCDCCQTTAAMSQTGIVVAYRDRVVHDAHTEIRDMKVLRKTQEGWINAENTPVDNWDIQACPVNGPVLVAENNQLALAWFTAADQKPKVKVAFSGDNGKSFESAIEVESENNLGRVGADWLGNNRLLVSWLGLRGDHTRLLYRIINRTGEMTSIETVADIDMSRASGVPQVSTLGTDRALFVWTQTGDSPALQTRLLRIK